MVPRQLCPYFFGTGGFPVKNLKPIQAAYSSQPIPLPMPRVLVKLVAVLLLFVQGLVAFAPGQVLCIPIQDCGTHEQGAHAIRGHCGADGRDDEVGGNQCKDHEHGPFSAAMHPDDECGCHLHVPVPDSEQVPSTLRGDSPDLCNVVLPLMVAFVLTWDCEPWLVVIERFTPPDFSVSDQVLALKATRLLI